MRDGEIVEVGDHVRARITKDLFTHVALPAAQAFLKSSQIKARQRVLAESHFVNSSC